MTKQGVEMRHMWLKKRLRMQRLSKFNFNKFEVEEHTTIKNDSKEILLRLFEGH